jgi:hypothetical protein
MGKLTRGGLTAVILRWASGLRFPWLFALTATLFALNLLIPDTLPLADEVLMGLVALLLGSLRKKPGGKRPDTEGGEPTQPASGQAGKEKN